MVNFLPSIHSDLVFSYVYVYTGRSPVQYKEPARGQVSAYHFSVMGNLCFLQFVAFTALVSAGYATLLQHSPTLITCSGDCCPECLHNAKLRPLTDKTRGLDSVSQTLSYSSDSCDERQCSFEYLEFKTRYAITDGTDFQKSGKGAIVSNVTAASIGLTVDLAQVSLMLLLLM